jgi:hypothetical protein
MKRKGCVMSKRCVACGGELEAGAMQARSTSPLLPDEALVKEDPLTVVSRFAFVRPGVPTSPNVLKAFLQGLHDEPGDQLLPIVALRCTGCGRLELYANPP